MNRSFTHGSSFPFRVPHVRGDEPEAHDGIRTDAGVFPTCVGMNRLTIRGAKLAQGVPHVRGDEPEYIQGVLAKQGCSPRAWGWSASSVIQDSRKEERRPGVFPCGSRRVPALAPARKGGRGLAGKNVQNTENLKNLVGFCLTSATRVSTSVSSLSARW